VPYDTKIATCSYCGSRQTLRLTARQGHELACGSCGAPLHEMKWLKPERERGGAKRSPRTTAPHGHAQPDWAGGRDWQGRADPRRKKKKHKKRKGMLREVMEEAFDLFDDIFD